jgi:hypothetical protein
VDGEHLKHIDTIIGSLYYNKNMPSLFNLSANTRTTLSGTPGGGNVKFLGGGPSGNDLLSNRHSPTFP